MRGAGGREEGRLRPPIGFASPKNYRDYAPEKSIVLHRSLVLYQWLENENGYDIIDSLITYLRALPCKDVARIK